MTNYQKCPFCGVRRMLYMILEGVKTRICYACHKVQQVKT